MQIILNAHSSNEHYNGDCDYAVIDLTPELAEQIRNRVALARQARQQDNDLYELYFWGSPAEFYDYNILDACQEAIAAAGGRRRNKAARDWLADFEQREYAVVPGGVDFTAHEAQRTSAIKAFYALARLRVIWKSRSPGRRFRNTRTCM